MDCPYCDHTKTHKHGKTSKGSQRYKCTHCRRTFVETFDTLYYWRQVTPEEIERILQCKAEGSSLRGISRTNKRAYNTVVSIVHDAGYRAQLVHNEDIKVVDSREVVADEMWSFVKKAHRLRRGFLGVKPEQAAEALWTFRPRRWRLLDSGESR